MDSLQRWALTGLAAAFPQAIVGEAGLKIWEEFLSDIPGPILAEVVRRWVMGSERPPTIAAIREEVAKLSGEDAEAAWKKVMDIVRNGRFRDRSVMGSPALPRGFTGDLLLEDAVREAGGWIALARSTEEQLVWEKKQFLAAYGSLTRFRGAAQTLGLANEDGDLLTDGERERLTDGN